MKTMGDTSDRLLEGSLNNTRKMSDYIQTGLQEVIDVGIELLENNGGSLEALWGVAITTKMLIAVKFCLF